MRDRHSQIQRKHTMAFSRKSLGIPYAVFLVVFVAAPLLFLFYYAFTDGQVQFTM